MDALTKRMWREWRNLFALAISCPNIICSSESYLFSLPRLAIWFWACILYFSSTRLWVCPRGAVQCITILSCQLGLNTENTEWGCSEADGGKWQGRSGTVATLAKHDQTQSGGWGQLRGQSWDRLMIEVKMAVDIYHQEDSNCERTFFWHSEVLYVCFKSCEINTDKKHLYWNLWWMHSCMYQSHAPNI